MKSNLFSAVLDETTGGFKEIYLNSDADRMNWVKPGMSFGVPTFVHDVKFYGADQDFRLEHFEQTESGAVAEYRTLQRQVKSADEAQAELTARTEYSFDLYGNITVKTTLRNDSRWQKFFLEGDIGVVFNFYDDYYDADTCMTSRCTAHMWCGNDSSWICALKMGESDKNIGLVFTEGGARSYSQSQCKTNDRGYFTFNLDLKTLRPNEEYVFAYTLFPHSGKRDFLNRLSDFSHCAVVEADNYTYILGEQIKLDVCNKKGKISVQSDLHLISSSENENKASFLFSADRLGEHRIDISYGDGQLKTYAQVFVTEDIETLVSRRLDYIVSNQQYIEEGNALDGAFMIFDTESNSFYYDEGFSDHNAQRERLGMTILLARYLQTHKNERLRAALDKAVEFVYRNVFDRETGEVFNYANKYSVWLRLYNFPWVALLLIEVYRAVGGREKLEDAAKIMSAYYERGGKRFYPNGIFVRDIITEFRSVGMNDEAELLQECFLEHVEQIIVRGLHYPKHEVNYEQTIVTPAVAFILDAYLLTGEQRYLEAIREHLAALERFDGIQPHHMLNNIAVRYWDDFWFGKLHSFGDTLPHYWSSLSSINYIKYAAAADDAKYAKLGVCGLRNCLCLFQEDGSASCARLYPFETNGIRGERYDPFCNDQDFALYFAYIYLSENHKSENNKSTVC